MIPKASEALDLLTEAAPVERFASLRRDLAALYAGYYVAELLNELTDLHDPHPKLFDAARITLRHLGESELRIAEDAPVRAGVPARAGADAGARGLRPLRDGRRTGWGTSSGSGWSPGACSARRAGPVQPHVVALSAGELRAVRDLASPGNAWRKLDPGSPGLARAMKPSGRSSVMSSGIAPDSAPYMGV